MIGTVTILRRIVPMVRLALFMAVVIGAGTIFVVARARAELTELMYGVGEDVMRYRGARQDEPRTLLLNGQRLHFSSGIAPEPPERVLSEYQARCEARDGGLGERTRAALGFSEMEEVTGDSVIRDDDGDRGLVACFDLGTGTLEPGELADRIAGAVTTGDLGAIGGLRFVITEPAGEGRTHFVAFWSEGSLRPFAMFPATGDAPGEDVAAVPRPPRSRRLASIHEIGSRQALAMYANDDDDPDALRRFYEARLPAMGFELLGDRRREGDRSGRSALTAERGDEMIMIVFDHARSGNALTSVLRLR